MSVPYSSNAPGSENGQLTDSNLNGQGSGSGILGDGDGGGNEAPKYTSIFPQNGPVMLTVGGLKHSADASSNFLIASQTLKPGGTAVTLGDNEVSVVSEGDIAYVGGSTQTLGKATNQPEPVVSFQGSLYTADGSSGFLIDGHRLTPGGIITAANTPISLEPNGEEALVRTSTQHLLPMSSTDHLVFTLNGATYTNDLSSGFIIDGQTLTPGAAITDHGTLISLPAGASEVVIGTNTQSLIPLVTSPAVITVGDSTYTLNSVSDFIIYGQTLTPGAAITDHGTVISLPTGASEIVIGTSTQLLIPLVTPPAVITIGDSTYTLDSASDFIIDGQTLTKGGVVIVKGTPISYAENGGNVVIATSTEVIDIGGLIMNGFGTGPPPPIGTTNGETGMVQFTDSAPKSCSSTPSLIMSVTIIAVVLSLAC